MESCSSEGGFGSTAGGRFCGAAGQNPDWIGGSWFSAWIAGLNTVPGSGMQAVAMAVPDLPESGQQGGMAVGAVDTSPAAECPAEDASAESAAIAMLPMATECMPMKPKSNASKVKVLRTGVILCPALAGSLTVIVSLFLFRALGEHVGIFQIYPPEVSMLSN